MLQRIYGTAWLTQADLDQYLWRLEEAKKRDHRKLGRELDLFDFYDVAPGAPFWLPNGMILVRELEKFARENLDARGYQEISTRAEKNLGTLEQWEAAETALADALKASGTEFTLNPGDANFYGPKIDIDVHDALGRAWQVATIQCDLTMLPERFQLEYIDADGQPKRPVAIHRAIYGSYERFIGILTEHYAGAFPTWLAPVQARVIPISEKH